MELVNKKQEKNLLELEVKGESVGFVNLVKEELWNDKSVEEAASIKEHPYMSEPKLYVKMEGSSNPVVAIDRANKRIATQLDELKGEFERALKD